MARGKERAEPSIYCLTGVAQSETLEYHERRSWNFHLHLDYGSRRIDFGGGKHAVYPLQTLIMIMALLFHQRKGNMEKAILDGHWTDLPFVSMSLVDLMSMEKTLSQLIRVDLHLQATWVHLPFRNLLILGSKKGCRQTSTGRIWCSDFLFWCVETVEYACTYVIVRRKKTPPNSCSYFVDS